jgi:hypothetical protein
MGDMSGTVKEYTLHYKRGGELHRSRQRAERVPGIGDFIYPTDIGLLMRFEFRVCRNGQLPDVFATVANEDAQNLWKEVLEYEANMDVT